MARAEQPGEKLVEVWEIIIPGTVWVWTYDRRNDKYQKQRVGGRGGGGSKRLQISVDDRRFNQQQVVDEMRGYDPFTNGSLRRISGPDLDPEEDYLLTDKYHLTDDQLRGLLEVKDEAIFGDEVREIESELILRRLLAVAEKDGTVWQFELLRALVEERYPVGGTQKTVREMMASNELQGGSPLM
jgi:hypothetical protein